MIRCMTKLKDLSIIYGYKDVLKNKNFIYRGHEKQINSVACKNDILVSGGDDKILRVWDIQTRKSLYMLKGHEDPILGIVISSNIISYSKDQLIIWNYNKTWPTFLRIIEDKKIAQYITIEIDQQVLIGKILSVKDSIINFIIYDTYIKQSSNSLFIPSEKFIFDYNYKTGNDQGPHRLYIKKYGK